MEKTHVLAHSLRLGPQHNDRIARILIWSARKWEPSKALKNTHIFLAFWKAHTCASLQNLRKDRRWPLLFISCLLNAMAYACVDEIPQCPAESKSWGRFLKCLNTEWVPNKTQLSRQWTEVLLVQCVWAQPPTNHQLTTKLCISMNYI